MSIQAMNLALRALEHGGLLRAKQAITALRAAIEQAEKQEPVAWLNDREEMYFDKEDAFRYSNGFIQPLYTSPPQREWQSLTDEEIRAEWLKVIDPDGGDEITALARAIEAKLKEKNIS